MKKDFLYEINVVLDERDHLALEIICGVIVNHGFELSEIVEKKQGGELVVSLFDKSCQRLEGLYRFLQKLKIKRVSLIRLKDKDWQDVWKESFKPFSISKKFDIVPFAYRKIYKQKNRILVYLDTSVAFGTGMHETTSFMARLIEGQEGYFRSFLDIGTGTGILALIASKCGGDKITAIDYDVNSIGVAQENFKANRYSNIKLKKADIQEFRSQPFDFVAANLFTKDLIRFKSNILALVKPGKFLAVSGISNKNYPELKSSYTKFPLKSLKVMKGKEWTACLLKRVG